MHFLFDPVPNLGLGVLSLYIRLIYSRVAPSALFDPSCGLTTYPPRTALEI